MVKIMKEEITNSTTQTPIEVALKIDENGMTTASNLYLFLELEPKNFSHWCLRNIKKNKFAVENEDYIVFVLKDENLGGRPKTDYKLTSDFAKKLSMTGNTYRHEQARQYFIACETGLKIATKKLQSQNTIDFKPITDVLTAITNNMAQLQQDMTQLKESQQSLQKQIPKKKFSSWTSKMFPKYQLLMDYFGITRKELYHNLYIELQNTYPDIDISQEQDDYCFENGLDSCFTLDVIEHNKNLRMLFSQLVDDLLEKYNLASTEDEVTRRKTIFDN